MRADLAEGEVLLGRFTLIRALDAEGASHVWVAEDAELVERVVLRILDPALAADRGHQERMRAACRRARRLRHPHIVPVFDFHRDDGICFVSRGYVEGGNLAALRDRPVREIFATLAPVLDALEYAHAEGVAHGGLRASKILVDRAGSARLADFSIAGALHDSVHPVAGSTEELARWKAEDLADFAALWLEVSGKQLPSSSARPGDVAALRRALAEAASVPAASPAPSVGPARGEQPEAPHALTIPIRLGAASGAEAPRAEGRAWAWPVFVALLGVAVGVLFWLPRWVESESRDEEVAMVEGATPAPPPAAIGDRGPGDELEAQRLLGEALGRRDDLIARGAETWGGEGMREAQARITAGETAQLESRPAEAEAHYRQALEAFAAVEAAAEERFAQALADAVAALEAEDASAAILDYEIALGIVPDDPTATLGLERARALEGAQSLLKAGARHEEDGELEQAQASYAEAMAVAPDWEPARAAHESVTSKLADSEYERRIAKAVTALARNDLGTARRQVDAALALRPGASNALDLSRRVAQKQLAVAIAQGRRRAQDFEAKEEWRAASEQYRKVLELDKDLTFAREGFDRCDRLASISERFDEWIARPALLFDDATRAEAGELLELARRTEDPGPRLRSRIDDVASLLSAASMPVSVTFESDGLTEVKVQRVGALGAFERREVPLKPGTYVILGIRRGFRDVRHTVTVVPGETPPTIVVRCVEAI
jgi:tetratricopeptide (TPR) repeat protein